MRLNEWVSLEQLRGLRPGCWISVGAGFSREDIKALILERNGSFCGDAIVNVEELCVKLLAAAQLEEFEKEAAGDPAGFADGFHRRISLERVLGPLTRQELLRTLLAQSRILEKLPELKRLKRQRTFYRKLDRALQSGRLAFSHSEELAVYLERLGSQVGKNPVREDLLTLAPAYEAWLQASGLWDPPLLLRQATQLLQSSGWPASLARPGEIVHFYTQTMESLESAFWDALSRHTQVRLATPLRREGDGTSSNAALSERLQWRWERWHTLDDAVEAFADALEADASRWDRHIVLIPDHPAVRRSIKRALDSRGIPLADPRDPTRTRWEEGLKWAMIPLEVVARGYERGRVISFLRAYRFQPEVPGWVGEINARGIRQGLEAYEGGLLSQVHSFLSELEASFGGRRRGSEISEAHLEFLRAGAGTDPERAWIVSHFERLWKDFVGDLERVGRAERRAPSLFWLEQLQNRMEQAPAPVEQLKARKGVRLYRLHTAMLESEEPGFEALWIFGMPSDWLSGEGAGDYWWSEREREILAGEFQVRSSAGVREERLSVQRNWLAQLAAASGTGDRSPTVYIMDAHYDFDGRERESILPVLKEIFPGIPEEAKECGAHPKWWASFGTIRSAPPQKIQLPPLREYGVREISATALEHYSRCGFYGLAAGRWKLWDVKEPETELWPEVRGNILHHAVGLLMRARDSEGNFSITPGQALEQAWEMERPKGLFKGPRLTRYSKASMVRVLEAFCAKEREYVQRSKTRVASLETLVSEPGGASGRECDTPLRLEYPQGTIKGRPDRIDEHPDGLFIMDYKASSNLPNGCDMVELGYRLQLPFYALAAKRKFGKEVIGVQFVELSSKGGRTHGIFPKAYNGKGPGNLVNTRSKLNVLEAPLAEIWSRCEEQLVAHLDQYMRGIHECSPKRGEKECQGCGAIDLCGRKRLSGEGDSGAEGEGE